MGPGRGQRVRFLLGGECDLPETPLTLFVRSKSSGQKWFRGFARCSLLGHINASHLVPNFHDDQVLSSVIVGPPTGARSTQKLCRGLINTAGSRGHEGTGGTPYLDPTSALIHERGGPAPLHSAP